MSENKVVVRQVRSHIGRTQSVRDTLKALGLGRIGKSKELVVNPATRGMLNKVRHLIEVSTVS